MFALFLSEWRRFRSASVSVAVGHLLLLWAAYHYKIPLFDLPYKGQQAALGFYFLVAALFTLAQLKAYATPSRWQWLVHRPLPLPALFGALALAATAHLAVMVGLPTLVIAVCIDWFTIDTIDLHHYLMLLFLFEICLIGWLLGAAVLVGRQIKTGLVVAVPAVLALPVASGFMSVLLAAVTIALLALVALNTFKADRSAPFASPRATALAAASIIPGFYILIMVWIVGFFEVGLRYTDTMPGHRGHRPAGGLYEASRIDQRSNILASLTTSNDPRRLDWQQRLPKATTAMIQPDLGRFAVRYQLSNAQTPYSFTRGDGMKVAFNQDLMRFTMTDPVSGKVIEQFGLHGTADLTPFPAIPVDTGQFLLAPQMVYSTGADRIRHVVRAVLPASEQIIAAPVKTARQEYYLLTSRRLVVYLPDAVEPNAPWKEIASVPLPAPVNDLAIVDIAALRDLTLLTFTGGRGTKYGAPAGQQTVIALDPSGSSIVAQRTLSHDYPLAYENIGWLLSPASYTLIETLSRLHDIGNTPDLLEREERFLDRPRQAWLIALALMLASGAMAWWILRRKAWRGWTVACLVFGVPALASLLALHFNSKWTAPGILREGLRTS